MADIVERLYPIRYCTVDHRLKRLWELQNTHPPQVVGKYKYSTYGDDFQSYESLLAIFEPESSQYADTMRLKDSRVKCVAHLLAKSAEVKGNLNGGRYNPCLRIKTVEAQHPDYTTYSFRGNNADGRLGTSFDNVHAPGDFSSEVYFKAGDALQIMVIPAQKDGDVYANAEYTHKARVEVEKNRGSVYIDAVWEDVVPQITTISPNSGTFIDNSKENLFSWNYNGGYTLSGRYNEQTDAVLEWRVFGSETTKKIYVKGTGTKIVVPSLTFPEKADVQWRVVSHTALGTTGESTWVTITTTNSTPTYPKNLSPANERVDNDNSVQFSWRHDIATGEAQTLAELQFSGDNGSSWQALGSITGDAQSYTVPAHSLPTGLVEWRVRTAGRTGVYGPWSQHTKIIVKASPPAPIISQVSASPRPAVQWQSVGQQGYRVLFQGEGISCDTGIHYGVERSAKCPMYLPDGAVTITVQVVNSIGVWSESSVTANVSNVDTQMAAPPAPEPSLHTRHGVVYLTWPPSQRYTRYYVLRDGQPVAVVTDGAYADKTAAGRPEYRVLGVYGKDADYYVASRPIPITVSVYSAMLVDMDAQQSLVYLRLHRDSPPTAKRTVGAYVEYQTFAGQTHPTPIFAGARTEGLDLEYTVLHSERQALMDMIGHTVCVKLRDGSVMFAILEGIQENIWKRTDVSLHFNRIEYNEVIPYV